MNQPRGIHGPPLQSISGPLSEFIIGSRLLYWNHTEAWAFYANHPVSELPVYFHNPFLLPDMLEAVECFASHIQKGSPILIYGDRDSDGVTSTALLTHYLKKKHPNARIHSLTSSQSDLYGLSPEAISKIQKYSPKLLVTLDFGTSHSQEIEELEKLGIQTIVIDHHEIPDSPHPSYLINPKRIDSRYPEKNLCTAFLTLKFIIALEFYLSDEFEQVYWVKESLFEGKYYRNGFLYEDKLAILPNREVYLYDLPGNPTLPDSYRLFYYQLRKIPGLLDIIFECSPLAGIGTITDMMPLTGENRILLKISIEELKSYLLENKKGIPGLSQLMRTVNGQSPQITSKDIGWGLGPVLNSAGRMGKTELALDLLLSEEESKSQSITQELLKINEERKERTKRNLHKMNLYFQRHPHKTQYPFVFCYEPDMEPGVSGIVATKMVESFLKPAVFIAPDNGIGKGSIRSYGNENVLELLRYADDILDHYGGHREAGGFSIALDKIPELEKRLIEKAPEWLSQEEQNVRDFVSEVCVRPEDLHYELFRELEKLEPTGQGNPPVLLSLKDVQPVHFQYIGDGTHGRFKVLKADGVKFLIWKNARKLSETLQFQSKISLWGYLEENYFQNKSCLQFLVLHFE